MEEGCAAIFWLVLIVVVIGVALAAIVYVVLPVSGALVVGLTLVGVLWGAVIAVRNFSIVLIEAHKNER